jgi:uncharacterized protein YdeI (YjbR/CyaY-like superfamily)
VRITETLYVYTRGDWRVWLEANHAGTDEIWLVGYRKHTGRPSLQYADAVEEALCFGWIDSIRKKIDDEAFAQRYTPRRPGSPYSQPNIERLRHLANKGAVMPEVLASVFELLNAPFDFPADVMDALRNNDAAWNNFQRYSEAYRRIRVAFVDSARNRPEEFEKRLHNLIRKSEQNRQFGHGIEAFYV